MKKSFRKEDSNASKEIEKFLDKYFYKKEVSDFERFTDKENQLKGKDVKFSIDGLNKIIVDEKAQIDYINKDIPTFAFEVDSLQQGRLTGGWLFGEHYKTQYYLLISIFSDSEGKSITSDQINKLNCILIERKKIIEFLGSQGLNKITSERISGNLRKKGNPGSFYENKFEFCKFYLSTHFAEMSVNIIIRKEKLKELATKIFIVKRED